jgi:hypothetical protein
VARETPLQQLISAPNQEWALDLVSNAISNGRALRALTIVDSYSTRASEIFVIVRERLGWKTWLHQTVN